MAKSNDTNFQNFENYLNSVKNRGYDQLKPTEHNPSIMDLVAEGMKLLGDNTPNSANTPPPTTNPKVLEGALGVMSKNPYVRARIKILNDMQDDRKKRIEEMEKTGNTDNPIYEDFCKIVRKLGDSFS